MWCGNWYRRCDSAAESDWVARGSRDEKQRRREPSSPPEDSVLGVETKGAGALTVLRIDPMDLGVYCV